MVLTSTDNSYTNTYTGTTTVNGGVLQVGVNGLGTTGTGATTVNSGGTLAGTGTITGTTNVTSHVVASGGTLSPGDNAGASIGTLTFQGNLNLNAGSTTNLKVGNTSPAQGTQTNDQIVINGSLTLNSGSIVNLSDAGGFAANAFIGETIDLFSWASLVNNGFNTGTNFRTGGTGGGDLNLPALSGGLDYNISSFFTSGTVVVAPEPGRMLLLVFGMAALVMRRRRKDPDAWED
jgi:autotransporter-associated beta strand protein